MLFFQKIKESRMELLRIINKTREITNEQLKDFYHVNDEQLL